MAVGPLSPRVSKSGAEGLTGEWSPAEEYWAWRLETSALPKAGKAVLT
jgi:hypothetical protein